MIIPKTKMVKKIDYTLYYTESIRRFSVLFLILCVSYFLTFTDFDITTVFVSIILLPFIIVSSEYKNQKIIRFYNSYKMNE